AAGAGLQGGGGAAALRQEPQALGHPVHAGDDRRQEQQQREVALHHVEIPGRGVADEGGKDRRSDHGHVYSSTCRMARKASWGTSTEPICFILFLPAFCFSRSLRLRLTSPP